MVSQCLIALSLLVVPVASVQHTEHTVHVFEEKGEACTVLDTTYTGIDLLTGTSCKEVVSDSVDKGTSIVALEYRGDQSTLKFKVHNSCEDMHGMTVVMEASEAESAKILDGECGEVISYFGNDEGTTSSFKIRMYMTITQRTSEASAPVAAEEAAPAAEEAAPAAEEAAPATTTARPATAVADVADQAESTSMVMPTILVVLAGMRLGVSW